MTTENKTTMDLTAKQVRHLKALAHHLKPVLRIGKEDLSDQLLEATRIELLNHELIKVKVGNNSGIGKKEAASTLATATESTCVQLIGKTIILYKENRKKAKDKRIHLPGTN